MTISAKPHELLRLHLEAKQKINPRLSLRYLARKLDLSPSYLSKVFAGLKPLPLKRLRVLAAAMDLDPIALRGLERAILRIQALGEDTQENLDLETESEAGTRSPLAPLPSSAYQPSSDQIALDEWYYLPILDLVTCHGFEPSWIGQRLGLRPEIAERAWNRLRECSLVENQGGKWRKVTNKIRFPAHRADSRIQRHHTKMLKKAADELAHRKTDGDFSQRLIVGASVATNEESYRRAEKYLEEALFKATDILSTGKADRVYYLAVQLFPLARPKK